MVASVPLSEQTDRLASVSHSTATAESSTHHQAEHSNAHSDSGSSITATHEKAVEENHTGNTEVEASTAVKTSSLPGVSPVRASMDKMQESVLKKPVVKLMTVEERGEGAVGWGVYQSYFQAANKPLLIVCLLLSFVLGTESYYQLPNYPTLSLFNSGFKTMHCHFPQETLHRFFSSGL